MIQIHVAASRFIYAVRDHSHAHIHPPSASLLLFSLLTAPAFRPPFLRQFARDRGLPIPWLAKVNPNTGVPVNATVCFGLFAAAFVTCWLNPTPSLAFNAVSGVNSNGFLFT